ncbi:MAG: lytic murein transglycosylase [Planktomarina sp.]
MLRYLFLLLLPTSLFAQTQAGFEAWLKSDLWPSARAAGIGGQTFNTAFAGTRLRLNIPGLKLPGQAVASAGQAEFRAPARYFRQKNLNATAQIGRQMAGAHATTLARIERQTGVPGRIILAIWGRESGFGRVKIPLNAFEVLATRAYVNESDYFKTQTIDALRIVQKGHIPADQMKSNWAGALGQPQMMPGSFLKYAADGDGDGRADIWGSKPDTLASIAHYLQEHGWTPGRDWGFEVTVPPSVSCTLEGPDQARSIRDWERMGITRVGGKAFPAHERGQSASLLMPAGRYGPAFLVTPNFYVLKKYNNSDAYALFVGHVGDKIAYGMGPFHAAWAPTDTLRRTEVAAFQRALEARGHDVGGADGLVGFKTRRSIGVWQEKTGQTATCFPSKSTVHALVR